MTGTGIYRQTTSSSQSHEFIFYVHMNLQVKPRTCLEQARTAPFKGWARRNRLMNTFGFIDLVFPIKQANRTGAVFLSK